MFALPLMFQLGFGLNPFAAGLLLIALNGGDLFTKPWIKPLFDRFGHRETVFFASLAGLASSAVFILVRPGPALVPSLVAALLIAGAARSLVFTGMTSLTYATLASSTMTSSNVVSSISMQLFNTLAVSATAVLLSLFAQTSGHAEPDAMDYRYALGVIAMVGLAATLRVRRLLPRNLREVHLGEAA
jgi:MFS family permease